jgi:hypothetical protein
MVRIKKQDFSYLKRKVEIAPENFIFSEAVVN